MPKMGACSLSLTAMPSGKFVSGSQRRFIGGGGAWAHMGVEWTNDMATARAESAEGTMGRRMCTAAAHVSADAMIAVQCLCMGCSEGKWEMAELLAIILLANFKISKFFLWGWLQRAEYPKIIFPIIPRPSTRYS
jgi:hypothetical protein